jgi:hypothetical protein
MASNRNVLKKYAPQARVDFIQAVTNRAAQFGISKDGNIAGEVQGDLFILNGKAFPRSVANQRGRLIARIAREGFAQVMEAVAYTWFNRFLAIRYMELHHFLDHGCRVLSSATGHVEPEILEKAASINLPGIDRDEIVNLKLDGTKDEVIYRKLLIAQCNDLHRAMPFLFEKIDDETELLLPENLLQSDSIVRKLVSEIDEAEWQEIEIIGWLYQFYISEKKDQVIGKVVKSEDIPAATQLFTPNWIVKYMVQNSLGAQWLATYPDSGIRAGMEYFIAPAEQTPEVQAQIDAITPKQLDPEAIKLIDPAVGSGHILVEAYDLFRAIYLERGYTKREAARAILTKNLFGLDIDDRAAQMAGFALLMKACADDRSVLRTPPKLNVLSLQDSEGLDAEALAKALLPQERFEIIPSGDLLPETLSQPTLAVKQPTSAEAKAIKALVTLFNGAKTYGSLITVPEAVMQSLPLLDALLEKPLTGDLYKRQAQEDTQDALKPLVEQARLLSGRYDCVVANPPYMSGMPKPLASYADKHFKKSKYNLYGPFIERNLLFAKPAGLVGMVTLQGWMFSLRYELFRREILSKSCIVSMAHLGTRGFDSIGGEVVSTTAFVLNKLDEPEFLGKCIRLVDGENEDVKSRQLREQASGLAVDLTFTRAAAQFSKAPANALIYWASENVGRAFASMPRLASKLVTREGMATGSNEKFLRFWHECDFSNIALNTSTIAEAKGRKARWFPYVKGGGSRRWYGNFEYVVNWQNEGQDIKNFSDEKTGRIRSHNYNGDFSFREGLSWSGISSADFAVRYVPQGFLFDAKGPMGFTDDTQSTFAAMGLLNSRVANHFIKMMAPDLDFKLGHVLNLPLSELNDPNFIQIQKSCIDIAANDWNDFEYSWEFSVNPIVELREKSLDSSMSEIMLLRIKRCEKLKEFEETINKSYVNVYGLNDEVEFNIPISAVTLNCNPHHRYYGDHCGDDRLKSDTMRELVSYAVGCMLGRYSLAEPGMIYAHSGNVGFDPSRYGSFPADDDGIVPLMEEQWFPDDAAIRIEEFLGVVWPQAPIMETLATLMDGLVMGKAGEPRAALRSYLSKQFYKDHLQTYKNRPIYWLFSSGKHKAFEALVYLHRYSEGTLARMRTVYVTPLMGKLQQRMVDLKEAIDATSSSAEETRLKRERDKLAKQVVELRAFDEELRHLADQRIPLDLDDGVKVNYARFGNLLAAKDKVCPKKKGEDE